MVQEKLEPTRSFERVKRLITDNATGEVTVVDMSGAILGNVYSGGAYVEAYADVIVRKNVTEIMFKDPAKCQVFGTPIGPILSCKVEG